MQAKTEYLIKYRSVTMVGPVCMTERGGYNRSLCHPILGDYLLKTVLTFNHKTYDAIVSKIDHTF